MIINKYSEHWLNKSSDIKQMLARLDENDETLLETRP